MLLNGWTPGALCTLQHAHDWVPLHVLHSGADTAAATGSYSRRNGQLLPPNVRDPAHFQVPSVDSTSLGLHVPTASNTPSSPLTVFHPSPMPCFPAVLCSHQCAPPSCLAFAPHTHITCISYKDAAHRTWMLSLCPFSYIQAAPPVPEPEG